jgi:cytoskeletal protein CcmA (bactofilin family)
MATTPIRYPVERGTGVAILGKSVAIKGQIVGREDLTIDGDVEGAIELRDHRLTVGPSGTVQSDVKAREVVIFGNVKGNIDATDKIEIRSNATLIGDIRTARVLIEDGAYFKGAVDITRKEPVGKNPAEASAGIAATGAHGR